MKKSFSLIIVLLSCVSVLAQHVSDNGIYEGMQWGIIYYDRGDERLVVDGKIVLIGYDLILHREIGGKQYFETSRKKGEHYVNKLFSIKGDMVIPYEYKDLGYYRKGKNVLGGEPFGLDFVLVYSDSGNDLYSAELKLLHSNVSFIPESRTFEGVDGKFLEVTIEQEGSFVRYLYTSDWYLLLSNYTSVEERTFDGIDGKFLEVTMKKDDGFLHDLYTNNWKPKLPRYSSLFLSSSGDYYFYVTPNGYFAKLDKNLNWIDPVPIASTQFEKIKKVWCPNEHYQCKKGGYWGLYDSKFNEVIAPEYEEFGYFENTNFIKFKLNGFWGVMALQGNTVKTIIPTTRGYTSIDRYIKSQKRFTYTMNGYKGECNHFGQQLSKIKVETPKPTSTSSNYSSAGTIPYSEVMTFDLKGNVKKCTMGTTTREFDSNGKYIAGRNEK